MCVGLADPSAGCALHTQSPKQCWRRLGERGAECVPGSHYLVTNTVIQYCTRDLPLLSAIWACHSSCTSHLGQGFIFAYYKTLPVSYSNSFQYLSLVNLTDKIIKCKIFNNCRRLFWGKITSWIWTYWPQLMLFCEQTTLVPIAQEASCIVYVFSVGLTFLGSRCA